MRDDRFTLSAIDLFVEGAMKLEFEEPEVQIDAETGMVAIKDKGVIRLLMSNQAWQKLVLIRRVRQGP